MATFARAFENLLQIAESRAVAVAREAARFTAFDVQRTAQRSIKSGGKNQRSKSWQTSKPGEPPRSHIGTLKKAIKYESTDNGLTYLIGPELRGSSTTLKTLEYGGSGAIKETDYSASYVAKKRQRKRPKNFDNKEIRCRVHGTVRASRPPAAHPYYIRSAELGRGVWVREYRYFYSREEWESARNSVSFQTWARQHFRRTTTSVHVAPRPFMRPALAVQTTETKNARRLTRAARSVERKANPVPY